ncbi:MAG: PilZ domain-containing protein [Candidatus Omnitrophota bacterium]
MVLSLKERRRFVRHPICYPLEFEYAPKRILERSRTADVSEGGLLFLSKRQLQTGKTIILKLPLQNKLFKVKAKVVHVNQDKENPKLYNVGVSFYRHSDAFEVKLVEQIYLMDEYRALRSLQLGRDITFKEASLEWVKKYAKKFDEMFWGKSKKSQKASF